jgi:DNA-nicking Smr family endonuclease
MKDYIFDVKLNITKHSIAKLPKRKSALTDSRTFFREAKISSRLPSDNFPSMSRRVRRKFTPEKTIDLHGLTVDEAFPVLLGFFAQCQMNGIRKIIVITGGNSMKKSVLRDSFRQWAEDSFGSYIADYSQSDIRHGGQGAFYVLLKKNKY